MEIVNVRIDERLIHGQVAIYWTNSLNATRIMVIDDAASKNDIQKMALKMAAPANVKLSILGAKRAVERLSEEAYPNERLFVVCKNPKTLVECLEYGYDFGRVNVGNMSSKHGSTQVKRTVGVTAEDVKNFRFLDSKGVQFYAQMVPADEPVEFMPLLANL